MPSGDDGGREWALVTLAGAVLHEWVNGPYTDIELLRHEIAPALDEEVFEDEVMDRLDVLIPPGLFPTASQVELAYLFLCGQQEDEDD